MRQSTITQWKVCPYSVKVRKEFDTVANQEASCPLKIGTMFHMAIEQGLDAAINWYYSQYYTVTDTQINEVIKLNELYDKIMAIVNTFSKRKHEFYWEYGTWNGTIDLMTENPDGSYDIIDFKYSNNTKNYLVSPQLHIYKYFMEKLGYKINRLGYIFIPKTMIREKQTEDIYEFRRRLRETLSTLEPSLVYIDYNEDYVTEALRLEVEINTTIDFVKKPSKLCDWCAYKDYCEKGDDLLMLPINKRNEVKVNLSPDIWIYGNSYSGKTVFVDSFDDTLFLNTDGNVDHISSPVLRIKDELTVKGRIEERKYAWQVFKDSITELEKKEHNFKRVAVDLLEDLYEHCRIYMYKQLNIEHESEAKFGKGYDMIKTEFLSNIKRLKNCGLQVILISKEIKAEVTDKTGAKITVIKPNLSDKLANVIAGTIDLSCRVVAEGNDRYLSFKVSPYIFGGGRYSLGVDKVELNKDKFLEVLTKSQSK